MLVSELKNFNSAPFNAFADRCVLGAKNLAEEADNIYQRGTSALDENWKDKYAEGARKEMEEEARSCEIFAMKERGAASIIDGFVAAVEIQQTELSALLSEAASQNFIVEDSGSVISPDPANQPKATALSNEIVKVLSDTSEIDADAARAMKELGSVQLDVDGDGDIDSEDVDSMRGEKLDVTAQTALNLMQDAMPIDGSPSEQLEWWESLTEEQKEQYKKALPVQLYDMEGLPDSLKKELAGGDGYNRIEVVRFAIDNAHNKDLDIFSNNCAHFVSSAFEAGGLDPKGTFTVQSDAWGHNSGVFGTFGPSHTRSWTSAEANQNFFLENGGEEVSRDDVQPGDIVYWEQSGHNPGIEENETHHTAVVTAVLPSGEVLYSQHTSSQDNVSLDARQPHNDVVEGDQNLIFVRPKETW